MANPWKESTKCFASMEEILTMSSAVSVFDKLNLDGKMLPVAPLKSKVDEYISQMEEIASLEEKIDKVVFEIQDIQFHSEYRDLLHSSEIEKKTKLLNNICDQLGEIIKKKQLLIELLQQKVSANALPLHRNFHK